MERSISRYLIIDSVEKNTAMQKLKEATLPLRAATYKLQMTRCQVRDSVSKKYKVSICAIFKNEAPYLREWIEFNHIVGVEHFYLYNNNSEDNYLTVLEPYIQSGLVTLAQWPKNQAQMECYQNCIKNYSSETQWLGFIDIDEFIVPKSSDTIYEILRPFENKRGAVKIYWRMFGTSGLVDRDLNGLVCEDFTVCWPKYYHVGKCFYNTNFEFNAKCKGNSVFHHIFWYEHNGNSLPPVNVFDKVCLENFNSVKGAEHSIQINHYFSKSYREYAVKKSRGDVFYKVNPHDEEYFYAHEMRNTSVDYSAYKYLIKLKNAMGKSDSL